MSEQKPTGQGRPNSAPPTLKVVLEGEGLDRGEFEFSEAFKIGRDEDCEIQIPSAGVSRCHAEVLFREGRWWLKDLGSANGTYLKGKKVTEVPLGATRIELGLHDAVLDFHVEGLGPQDKTRVQQAPSVTEYVDRYFSGEGQGEGGTGAHTKRIREAFQVVQKKQKTRYYIAIAAVALVAIVIGVYSYYQDQELKRQRQLAEEIFYSMKSLELQVAQLESQLSEEASGSLSEFRVRETELLRNYENLIDEMEFYDSSDWSDTDRVILRVARLFGECELAMPPEFLELVYEYIEQWKSSDRLPRGIKRAEDKGYDETVVRIMLEHHLPPHFFFLAMQESDFREQIVGPKTRYGIAKGMWQFIPATAVRYGLKTGPLVELRRYDPDDERFVFEKASAAAARYIRDIYNSEAQASGLLVLASYNWGEGNIRSLVRKMPMNPRERNFWQLLELHGDRIPKETYDYVFKIISAAIIAEDPALFGFDFESPLEIPEE